MAVAGPTDGPSERYDNDRPSVSSNPDTVVATLRLHAEFPTARDRETEDPDEALLATAIRLRAALEAGSGQA